MADGRQLPFPDARFEVVLSCGVLEHVGVAEEWEPEYRVAPLPDQAEQRRRFLAECLRVLRPTGVLYLDHPNGAFPIDFWHTKDAQGRQPRFHSLREGFLPSFGEVRHLAREIDPRCRVRALSPAGRFTFRRVKRRWYGQVFGGPSEAFFNLLRYWPLKWLAATPLNPYLVIEISRQTY